MILEFRVKIHYGREDFYPMNEGARLILDFKCIRGEKFKTLQRKELEHLKRLGFEIRLVSTLEEI
jgi:hypothetical protein